MRLEICLADDGIAVSLQNGFGNREILEAALGAPRVSLGVTTIGATLLGPGKVRPGGAGVITLEDDRRLDALVHLLKTAGFSVNLVPDAKTILWGKLVINAAINPLSALLEVPNGTLLERPTARQLMSQAATEAAEVACAMGVQLPYPYPVAAVEDIAARTSANYSSMLQDIRRGAPTEINAISGAIVRFGQQVGVPTPVTRLLWQLVNAKEGT
jgi:2-dehydropantoate 2-reductase